VDTILSNAVEHAFPEILPRLPPYLLTGSTVFPDDSNGRFHCKEVTKMADEMYTAGKLAKALGVSQGKVKKLLASLEIEPDEVKRNCKYYGGATLEKLKAALAEQ
jgi:hypothetical protein